jgi:hypothetical protein
VNWQSTRTATDVLVSDALMAGPVDMGGEGAVDTYSITPPPPAYIVQFRARLNQRVK